MLRVRFFQDRQPLFDGSARQVVLPGEDGEVSVLDFHAPMLCALGEGAVHIDEARFPVHRGVARVERNVVTILAH